MIATMVGPSQEPQPPMVPILTFHGPDTQSQIKAIHPSGQEVAQFELRGASRSSFTISRMVGPNQPPTPICNASKSSIGHITMTVHGRDSIIKSESIGLAGKTNVVEDTPFGKLEWITKSGGVLELRDQSKRMLARGIKAGPRLDIFVQGDEVTLDFLLAVWMGILHRKWPSSVASGQGSAASGKGETLAAWINGLSALAGAGGGAGGGA